MLRSRANKAPVILPHSEQSAQRKHDDTNGNPFNKYNRRNGSKISPHSIAIRVLVFLTIAEGTYFALLGEQVWKELVASMCSRLFGSFNGFTPTPTIDNYYKRTHIRTPVPLIVGGSDGSGTRAFVHVLEELAVPMVIDDRGTMDVHGRQIFQGQGWPALVSKVLDVTRSATYDVHSLPQELESLATNELNRQLKDFENRGMKTRNFANTSLATAVSWGFKAPISQLLLPFFRKELSALKFLHIVRDGRDVALSNNQSPVEKFYSNYYEDASDREASMKLDDFGEQTRNRVKAIQLWNDWNKQVYEYGIQNSDGNTFDVLVMRTEDFLDHPFESLFQLADFVGSPKTPHEICCISLKATKDFGKSDANSAPAGPYVRIPDYQQIREHFQKFSPSKPFDEIKEPVFANAHKGADKPIMEKEEQNESNAKRKLLEKQPENDDEIDVLPGKLEQKGAGLYLGQRRNVPSGENLRKSGIGSQSVDQIKMMQKVLDERRGHIREAPKPEEVKGRYGKWVQLLKGNPILSERLLREGGEALRLFGYEPRKSFMDDQAPPFTCDESVLCSP